MTYMKYACQNLKKWSPLFLLLLYIFAVLVVPIYAPHDPLKINMNHRFAPVSMEHLLGTDHLGRDLFSRMLVGGRVTVGMSFLALLLILIISIPLGILSGFLGGWFDRVCMRVVDAFLAFPDFIVAIVLTGLLGPSLFNVMLAIVVAKCGSYIRVVRSTILTEKEKDYILMAIASGLRTIQIVKKHFFPHIIGNVIVLATLDLGKIILMIAALSYIGLGAQPPIPEWGTMLSECKSYVHNAPHLMLFPGGAIMCTVLISNLVGDQLRDRFSLENR